MMLSSPLNRLILTLLAVMALAAFFALSPWGTVGLEGLQAVRDQLALFEAAHPAALWAGALLVAALLAMLPGPGRIVAAVAAGAACGFFSGGLAAACGAAFGAAAVRSLARGPLSAWARRRFGPGLRRVNFGVERKGAWYLFSLRLTGSAPFFLTNVAVAFTRLRPAAFLGATFLGLLPEALLLANAGRALAAIRVPGDLASPGLLSALALAVIGPLALRHGLPLALGRAGRAQTG
ncbi:VTT domain-containing protein [Desulfovibrio aminophilus]|nr:VTT domain-containing protein [Desulfovibrio aminophilus]MCM0756193.1 VTT domain-containing protein [Desulfovibrio aminophilus]